MTFPDSIRNPSTIAILTTPSISPGDHQLEVEVRDIKGNLSQLSIPFSVSGDFEIRVFGNYPNPFQDETIISYFINSTRPIDEFSIKIYSTSGRLVRSEPLTLDPSVTGDLITAANYHELVWDGTDDDGHQVANGVYFAVIKGKFEGKTVERKLKMAKLK
jgi:flagellar hook assembly protein FlgD